MCHKFARDTTGRAFVSALQSRVICALQPDGLQQPLPWSPRVRPCMPRSLLGLLLRCPDCETNGSGPGERRELSLALPCAPRAEHGKMYCLRINVHRSNLCPGCPFERLGSCWLPAVLNQKDELQPSSVALPWQLQRLGGVGWYDRAPQFATTSQAAHYKLPRRGWCREKKAARLKLLCERSPSCMRGRQFNAGH